MAQVSCTFGFQDLFEMLAFPVKSDPSHESYVRLIELLCSMSTHVACVCDMEYRDTVRIPEGWIRTPIASWPGVSAVSGRTMQMSCARLDTDVQGFLQVATTHLYGWRFPSLPEDLWFVNANTSRLIFRMDSLDQEAYLWLASEEVGQSDEIHELTDAYLYPPLEHVESMYEWELQLSHIDILCDLCN